LYIAARLIIVSISLALFIGINGCMRHEIEVKSVNVKLPLLTEITYDTIEVILNSTSKQILVPLDKLMDDTLEMSVRIEKQQFPSSQITANIIMNNCKIQRINLSYSVTNKFSTKYVANPVEFSGSCNRKLERESNEPNNRCVVLNSKTLDILNKSGFKFDNDLSEEDRTPIDSMLKITNKSLMKNWRKQPK